MLQYGYYDEFLSDDGRVGIGRISVFYNLDCLAFSRRFSGCLALAKNQQKIKMPEDIEFLPVRGEKFKLLKFSRIISEKFPLLMIMAGCHGEEPAPVLSIFENYKVISQEAEKYKVNLVIYPLVNPWGFSRGKRMNRLGLNCNRNWFHEKISKVASEVKAITKDIVKYKPDVFIDLHEDDETKKLFYIFTYGNKKFDKNIVKAGSKFFPVLKDGHYKTHLKEKVYMPIEVKKGAVHDHHDGSAEDWLSHRGCKFACCTETPSDQPLKKRIDCNRNVLLEAVKLTSL